jgi:hypothetical protein
VRRRVGLAFVLLLAACDKPGVEITFLLGGDLAARGKDAVSVRLTVDGDAKPCCAGDIPVKNDDFADGKATLRYKPAATSAVSLAFHATLVLRGSGGTEEVMGDPQSIDWSPGATRRINITFGAASATGDGGMMMSDGGMFCVPGVGTCESPSTLKVCNADGSAFVTKQCPSADCNVCGSVCGQRYCKGDDLSDCSNGTPVLVTSCAYGCDPAVPACRDPAASNFNLDTFLTNDPGGGGCKFSAAGDAVIDTTTPTGAFTNFEGQQNPTVVQMPNGFPSEALVIPCQNLTIPAGSTLRLKGARAVIFAVYGAVTVDGTISAGGNGAEPGPGGGGSPGPLGAGVGGSGAGHALAGSGGGGNFQNGGNGGAGNDAFTPTGGVAQSPSNVALIPLLAGAAAGAVANNSNVSGVGGGAVQITSRDRITVSGIINAGGGGGERAQESAGAWGAHGGGAGGGILLEAPSVSISGVVVANGGAGGGSAPSSGGNCMPVALDCGGENGTLTTLPAAGGKGQCVGGNGGSGTVAPTSGTSKLLHDSGMNVDYTLGCGGGGSAGRIRINAKGAQPVIAAGSVMSPAPSVGRLPAK